MVRETVFEKYSDRPSHTHIDDMGCVFCPRADLERVVGRQKDLVERKNASVGTKVSLACEQLKYAPSRTCFWETQKHLTSDTGLGLGEYPARLMPDNTDSSEFQLE